MQRSVQWSDRDQAGHVNNTNYLAYIEDCTRQAAAAFGWPASRLVSQSLGILTRHYRIEYRLPAMMGDNLTIATWLSDVQRTAAVRHYTINRQSDGQNAARARVRLAWVDLASDRPVQIPAAFLDDFAANIAA